MKAAADGPSNFRGTAGFPCRSKARHAFLEPPNKGKFFSGWGSRLSSVVCCGQSLRGETVIVNIFAVKAVAAGAIAVLAATSLVACSPGASSRLASAYRASHLCVLNATDTTILSVGEFAMRRTGESHPDPTGPLEPGATWCTNGYNSFQYGTTSPSDANVEIRFTDNYGDFMQFVVSNWEFTSPLMEYGRNKIDDTFDPGPDPWEIDVTIPKPNAANGQTGASHDYHLRRLDDTTYFIEWLITVRR